MGEKTVSQNCSIFNKSSNHVVCALAKVPYQCLISIDKENGRVLGQAETENRHWCCVFRYWMGCENNVANPGDLFSCLFV